MKWTDLLGIGWSAMGAPDSRLVILLHGAQVISGEQGVGRRTRSRSELVCCWHQSNSCRLLHHRRCEAHRSLL